MRLLFLSQLFDPEYSIKGITFLAALRDRGFDIQVVTTFPNYPMGKIYPGYKLRMWEIEVQNNIKIVRVYSFITQSKSKFFRALSYSSFMISALIAMCFLRKPDVVYAYHPQITTGLIASIYGAVRSVPFITDVQDLWPDALLATGTTTSRHLVAAVASLCNLIYRRAAHIVALSIGYKEALVGRGVSAEKITVVYNWTNESTKICDSDDLKLDSGLYKYKFVYAGNLGAAQDLRSVISAFAGMHGDSVSLTLIGSGVEESELRAFSCAINTKNVFFMGYVPASKISALMQQADVLVAHLRNEPLFKITVPSKTQSYLLAAKPILMAVKGECVRIIETAKAGICAEPQNVDSIINAAKRLVAVANSWKIMGLNGRDYYYKHMSMKQGEDTISYLLATLKENSIKSK